MQRLNPSVSGALRSFAFWLANRSPGGDVLRDVDYGCIFNEPSALEQVFAIFANVITLDDEGRVLNAKWAERRAAHYIRQYVTGIPADPILQPWECTLHPPPPKTDLPD